MLRFKTFKFHFSSNMLIHNLDFNLTTHSFPKELEAESQRISKVNREPTYFLFR